MKLMNATPKLNAFERMAAAGMSRLLRHMMAGPFAILSADRAGMTPDERVQVRYRLREALREMGLGGGVATEGAWREDGGERAHEGSYFVPGLDAERAALLGHQFGQDSVIVGDRGKFGFLDTKNEPTDFSVVKDFDLAHVLNVPSLSQSIEDEPNMFTKVNNRKFELRTDEPPDFTPEEIVRLRARYQAVAEPSKEPPSVWPSRGNAPFKDFVDQSERGKEKPPRPQQYVQRPPVREEPLYAFIYADKPPIMHAKFGIYVFAAPKGIMLTPSLIVDVPFTATIAEVQPEFEPSPHWGEAPMGRTAAIAEPIDSMPYERALADAAQFHGDVDDLFMQRKPGSNMKSLDSLYVGRDGSYFMLRPHSHDEVAREVMRTVDPSLPAIKRKGWPSGGYTHHDLGRASGGIMRTQFYPDGMGVTIDMNSPPNRAQLDAIRRGYRNTPMERFVAEIVYDGNIITHLESFGQLLHFVNAWDPNDPTAALALDPKLGELYDRNL